MGLIYVTGASGAGKSTVLGELRRRGFVAHGTDEDGLARWYENSTHREASMPADPDRRDDDWYAHHTYRLPPDTVRRLAAEVGDDIGFVCGTVGNDNEIWDLFTSVVSLSVDATTIRRRLGARGDGFGSTEAEVRRILAWHKNVDADNARFGAVLVDATGPVSEVVDRVLASIGTG
ncbi:ribose 1,5-bisphosphokinase PhnN [Kribbella amoyensis]|uniref:Ribose 1,5-bisphosphokinase PhnN n=1 Tax=Kribbella amoyensis TaxID=996641 RepID=A0A561BR54_9ACTN|nr:hypothetical protein [Kribbella amoyensis]TWD81367.1 ribose 1,5-bisphosphokinase PhnN [Kribbella amoyensis]